MISNIEYFCMYKIHLYLQASKHFSFEYKSNNMTIWGTFNFWQQNSDIIDLHNYHSIYKYV